MVSQSRRRGLRSSQIIMSICIAHIYKAERIYKTLHTNASQSSLRHSRHCGLNTVINNKPHQTFRETNRIYGLGISTHSTALNCSGLAKGFQSLSALISGGIPLSTKLNPDQGQKVTTRCLCLNRYLVPLFGVHRMCVPYGMWGLKTQQVIQPERSIVYLTDDWGLFKYTEVI